jgi:hypothetical protein
MKKDRSRRARGAVFGSRAPKETCISHAAAKFRYKYGKFRSVYADQGKADQATPRTDKLMIVTRRLKPSAEAFVPTLMRDILRSFLGRYEFNRGLSAAVGSASKRGKLCLSSPRNEVVNTHLEYNVTRHSNRSLHELRLHIPNSYKITSHHTTSRTKIRDLIFWIISRRVWRIATRCTQPS